MLSPPSLEIKVTRYGRGWGWWRCCLIRLANRGGWEEFLALRGGEKRKVEDANTFTIFFTSFFRGCRADAESQPRVDGEATRRKPSGARTDTWGRYGDVGERTADASARSSSRRSDFSLSRLVGKLHIWRHRKWDCIVFILNVSIVTVLTIIMVWVSFW